MNQQSLDTSGRTTFFTTENHDQVVVLKFSRLPFEHAANLQDTERLWEYFESLRRDSTKILLVEMEDGGLSPAVVDKFWRRARDEAVGQVADTAAGPHSVSELRLPRTSNLFRRFVEVVRELDTFVVATLEKDVDFTFLGPALACDYRVAAEDAVFVNRFFDLDVSPGITPWFLSRCLGPAVAAELLLNNKIMTAVDAYELGLVNRLVSPGSFQMEALAIAEELASRPANALIDLKRAVIASSGDLSGYLDALGAGFSHARERRRRTGR